MEPGTGLAILGTALGGAKVIEKILGPTADYLGDGLRNWTERRVHNVAGIFTNTESKLGDRIDEPGSIPPRVLKEILDEGSYCDDSLTAEYFGGVLASSRTRVSRDDRGVYWTSLVARLSTYQIRSHFLIYRAIYDRFRNTDFRFGPEDRRKLSILLPFPEYILSMEFNQEEGSQFTSLLEHVFHGLQKEGLIENFYFGPREFLKKNIGAALNPPGEGGIWVQPSNPGAELFLWSHGQGTLSPSALLHQTFVIPEGIIPCTKILNEEDLEPQKSRKS